MATRRVVCRALALIAIATTFLMARPGIAQTIQAQEFRWDNEGAALCIDLLTAASISANLAALLASPPPTPRSISSPAPSISSSRPAAPSSSRLLGSS